MWTIECVLSFVLTVATLQRNDNDLVLLRSRGIHTMRICQRHRQDREFETIVKSEDQCGSTFAGSFGTRKAPMCHVPACIIESLAPALTGGSNLLKPHAIKVER